MSKSPRVFVSAVSGDLGSVRQIVKEALLTMGCHPIEQTNFPPDHRTVVEMLEEKIQSCQALVHIAGIRYGAEPQAQTSPDDSAPRRSYTQLELDIARRLGKKVYTFICPEDFPFDDFHGQHPEDDEKAALQAAHRADLLASDSLHYLIQSPVDLREKIKELEIRVEEMAKGLEAEKKENQKTRKQMLTGVAVILIIVGLLGGGGWIAHRQLSEDVSLALNDPNVLKARIRDRIEQRANEEIDALNAADGSWQKIVLIEEQRDMALASLDNLIETISKNLGQEATRTYQQAARILEKEGVDAAISYLKAKRTRILAKDDDLAEQADALQNQREKQLEPLILEADLHQTNLDHDEALELYQLVVERLPTSSQYQRKLGTLLKDLGKLKDAEKHLLAAVASARDDEEKHPAQNSLALIYSEMARYAEAEKLFRENLEAMARIHGPDSALVARVHNNLGTVLSELGNKKEAEQMYRRAVEIEVRIFGSNHPQVSNGYSNLGNLLHEMGQVQSALFYLNQALRINQSHFGPAHPRVAAVKDNLAGLLNQLGQQEKAEQYHLEALEAYETIFGPNHPNVAMTLGNLGLLHLSNGRPAEAEPYLRRALTLREAVYGPDHPLVSVDLVNLAATITQNSGDLKEVEKCFRRALAIDEKIYGPDSVEVAVDLSSLAGFLVDLRKFEEAEGYYRRALEILEPKPEIKPATLAGVLFGLGIVEGARGNMESAADFLERSLKTFHLLGERNGGREHRGVARVRSYYQRALQQLGKSEQEIASQIREIEDVSKDPAETDPSIEPDPF